MSNRVIVSIAVMSAAAAIALPAFAQAPAAKPAGTAKTSPAPKTPWGEPDLQGTWTSDDTWGVPMERPAQYGDRLYLTEQELAEREKRVQQGQERLLNPGDNHSPAVAQLQAQESGQAPPQPAAGRFGRGVDAAPVPGHWGEAARRASKQTSQIVDPPNGKIPALTPEAQQKLAAKTAIRRKAPETWTDWSYYDRCITRGVEGSIIPVIYGNGLEIVQSPGYVAIRYEMVHDQRLIPTDGRPHSSSSIRTYMGDPVGHWEGNTLVVETTNFIGDRLTIGANGDGGAPYSDALVLTERYTRVAPNVVNYEATINDPKTYTAPWKIAFPITHEPGYKLFEYACHEGNMSMRNMLSAARAEAEKKQKQITKEVRMRTNWILFSVAAAGLMVSTAPVRAHHAFTAEFDADKPLVLHGTVTKMEWINPHAWIHIDVKDADGKVTSWMIEAGAPNGLLRRGFNKSSLVPGTEIVVEGWQAKDGSNRANGSNITLPDGRKLFVGSTNTGAPNEKTEK